MENYWEIKSRLEVDGAVFLLQALQYVLTYILIKDGKDCPIVVTKMARFCESVIM